MKNKIENNLILRSIIQKELPSLDLSKREKRILKKRREGALLKAIGVEETPVLTRERIRQIILRSKEKEIEQEKIIKKVIDKINKHLKKECTY